MHFGNYIELRNHQHTDCSLRFLAFGQLYCVAKQSIYCFELTIPCISAITLSCETIDILIVAYDSWHFANYIELRNPSCVVSSLRFLAFRQLHIALNSELIHILFLAYDPLHFRSYIELRNHQYMDFNLRFLAFRQFY